MPENMTCAFRPTIGRRSLIDETDSLMPLVEDRPVALTGCRINPRTSAAQRSASQNFVETACRAYRPATGTLPGWEPDAS